MSRRCTIYIWSQEFVAGLVKNLAISSKCNSYSSYNNTCSPNQYINILSIIPLKCLYKVIYFFLSLFFANQETNGFPDFLKCPCRVTPNICIRSTKMRLSANMVVLQRVSEIFRSLLAHRGSFVQNQKTSFVVLDLERKGLRLGIS